MKKVRYGIIGVGNQGNNYSRVFQRGDIQNGVLRALCDNNEVKLNAARKNYEDMDLLFFDDYKTMLDSGEIDAVLVETPHYQHPELVIECLNRGLHVICDKPAGVYTKQVREMNEVAKNLPRALR